MKEVSDKTIAFADEVTEKYNLYNKLFLTLPFEDMPEVGVKLPEFSEYCQQELTKGSHPTDIVNGFFESYSKQLSPGEQTHILLLFTQFIERQIVLFDALEDGAFASIHEMNGEGSIHQLINKILVANLQKQACEILQTYSAHIVLTAHPTQFYPPQVLGVINDLAVATSEDNLKKISDLLLQLGMTSFRSRSKPTPLNEAETLMQYLETVFYPVIKRVHCTLTQSLCPEQNNQKALVDPVSLGFWPGGDRDGNPEVTAQTTLDVAKQLKYRILDLYKQDIKRLKTRLTFPKLWEQLIHIQDRIEATQQIPTESNQPYVQASEFINDLQAIRELIIKRYQGLFVDAIDEVVSAVKSFGFHFAAIDLRQDSSVHEIVLAKIIMYMLEQELVPKTLAVKAKKYSELHNVERYEIIRALIDLPRFTFDDEFLNNNPDVADVIQSLEAAKVIQQSNGEAGLHRYIISNTQAPHHVLAIVLFAHWAGWDIQETKLDIIPLFETIDDLVSASEIMRRLYQSKVYKKHLSQRDHIQTIMLGFSDGTKDGGYLTANWAIFRAKQQLAGLAQEYGINVVFFDGRGGPPARGGGNTHKFYQSIESVVPQREIQLTIQGQTISSKFGTIPSARYNVEQLFTSCLAVKLFEQESEELTHRDYAILDSLSTHSYRAYQKLREHPLFVRYLEEVTPLKYFGELNIASRPPRRQSDHVQSFKDLRAIPFVGAWSQIKQNVPGFYGLGTALKLQIEVGQENALQTLYQHSLFFRTLLENAMQSLAKSRFELTQYLKSDETFGEFWQLLKDEYDLTLEMLKRVTGQAVLLQTDPVNQQSIQVREQLVLPLLVIQQHALSQIKTPDVQQDAKQKKIYNSLILKALAATINASRNSA